MTEYDVKYIEKECIECEPEISSIAVHRNENKHKKMKKTGKIIGMNSEDKTLDEGTVFYDIRFYAKVPNSGEIIKLIINVEAQNEYYVGYPIIKRAIYYACRQISAQYGTEFTENQYQDIKKVYSIWVLNKVPKKIQNTITKYKITEENVVGKLKEAVKNYDLINIIMICLEDDNGNPNIKGVLKLLRVLLSDYISADRKTEMLENEFDIEMNEKIEQELINMCNLSYGILERGIEQGIEQGIKQGIEQGIKQGIKQGIEQGIEIGELRGEKQGGISVMVKMCKEFNINLSDTINRACAEFNISKEEAEAEVKKHWE